MDKISKFMNHEHEEINLKWANFVKEGLINERKKKNLFETFSKHLLQHITIENEVLFKSFEEYTGIPAEKGPTGKLREDHDHIMKLIKDVETALQKGDEKTLEKFSVHLGRALEKHHERENKVTYPLSDTFISKNQWQSALNRIYN